MKTYKYYLEICNKQNEVLMESKYFNKFVEVVNYYNEYIDYADKTQCNIHIMQQDYYADTDEYGDSNIIDVFE